MPNNKMADGSLFGILVLILILILWVLKGFLFPSKIPAPELKISFRADYPGEFSSEVGDSVRVTLTDRVLRRGGEEGVFFGAMLRITVEPEEAWQKKADAHLKIIAEDGTEEEKMDSSGSIWIHARNLKYGKNKLRIVAENVSGTATKELIIQKVTLESVCLGNEKYKSDSACDDFYEDEAPVDLGAQSWNTGLNNTSQPATGNHCYHYENEVCWDELEEQAYDDGRWDKAYGRYGDGYNPPDDCTGFCADLYEDAYEEGFYDQ